MRKIEFPNIFDLVLDGGAVEKEVVEEVEHILHSHLPHVFLRVGIPLDNYIWMNDLQHRLAQQPIEELVKHAFGGRGKDDRKKTFGVPR